MNQSHVLRSFGPRSMFFSARDLLLDNPSVSGIALAKEQSTRQHLVNEAVSASELLITSFKAIRTFDALGNVAMTSVQIDEARTNALQKIHNLLESIERTNSRVRNQANAEIATAATDEVLPAIVNEEPAGAVERVHVPSIMPTPADFAAALGLDKVRS